MGFYLNKVAIMSNNKEYDCKSWKELKDQLTFIDEEFGKEMMKNNFKNYLEYVSNGDSLDQGRKIHKHEQDVRKTLEKLLKLFVEKDVIEIVDGFKFKFLGDEGSKDTAGEVMESFRDKRNRPNDNIKSLVVIMSKDEEYDCKSCKELKAQLTFINKEFDKEMMKEHFKNYLEYVSNGDSLDQGREIEKHEQDVRKLLDNLLKLYGEKKVIEIVDGFKLNFLGDEGSKDTAGEVMESFRDKRNRPN